MSRSSEPKIPISLTSAEWTMVMNALSEDEEDQVALIRKIDNKLMSRSTRKEPEAVVVSPLEFAGVTSKTFAISSKEREPIEQLLPVLSGNILIITSWEPNISGIEACRLKGKDKTVVHAKITKVCEISMLMKTRNVAQAFDHVIVDRIDEIDNGKNKRDKAAQIKGVLTQIPGLLGRANMFITTMMGIPILYESVDEHKVV